MMNPLTLTTLALGLALLRPAEAVEPLPLDPARRAAILPEAGFVAHVDVAALGNAALVKSLLPLEESEMLGRLVSITGLRTSELLDVLVSAKSDGIAVERSKQGQRLSRVPGIMAISLARPITVDELGAALESAWRDRRGVSTSKAAEFEIAEVAAAGPAEPGLFAATSLSGRVVFLTSDRPALVAALERERDGLYAPLAPGLEALESSLSPGHQAYFLLLTPPALRDRLRPGEAGQRPATMIDRVLEPFGGLESLAIGATVSGDARLELLGELGDAVAAQRAEELLRSFLLPNLLRTLSMRMGGAQLPGDAVAVASRGSLTRVSLRIRPEDVEALLAARKQADSDPPGK